MEQFRTGTILNPLHVGGRLIVVNETEMRGTRSALPLQEILRIGTSTLVTSRDLGSGKQLDLQNLNHFICDEYFNWKAPPSYITQVITQSPPDYILTPIKISLN